MPANPAGTVATFTPTVSSATAANPSVLQVSQAEPQLSRTYYQDGRLLTAADLNRDYNYLDQRLLDLGLALGDGVAQGLEASLVQTNGQAILSVNPGRGIAPSGRVVSYSPAAAGSVSNTSASSVASPNALVLNTSAS